MLSESEQHALRRIRARLADGNSLEALRRQEGLAEWIDHFEEKGVDLSGEQQSSSGQLTAESLPRFSAKRAPTEATPSSTTPSGSGTDQKRWQLRFRLLMVLAAIFFIAAAAVPILVLATPYDFGGLLPDGDDPLGDLAVDTCSALESSAPSRAGSLLSIRYSEARAEGYDAEELEVAVREECPESVGLLDLTQVAADACAELEGAIVLEAGGIINRAIRDAEGFGFSGPELGDAMRADCPNLMAAIEDVAEDQERREQLPNEMFLVHRCFSTGAAGTVTNLSDVTVDVFIEVQFLDDRGTLIDDSIDSVNGLRAGETGTWEATFLGRFDGRSYATCRAEVSDAFEQ